MSALFCLRSYIDSHCLAVRSQSASKNLKKNVEDRVRSQKLCTSDVSVFFYFFKGEKSVLKLQNKIRPQSPKKELC
jgi:hypothetical protein